MSILYHAAPRAHRASIHADGIDCRKTVPANLDQSGLEGNYLFASLANARHYAALRTEMELEEYGERAYDYEVWAVDSSGLDIFEDASACDVDPEIAAEYPDPIISFYTLDVIFPKRCQLLVE